MRQEELHGGLGGNEVQYETKEREKAALGTVAFDSAGNWWGGYRPLSACCLPPLPSYLTYSHVSRLEMPCEASCFVDMVFDRHARAPPEACTKTPMFSVGSAPFA